jgi:arabinofuranan 3-O-arabinosyltransferase
VKTSPRIDNFFLAPYQRKIGAEYVHGEYIFFADSDFILVPGLLRECLASSEEYDALIIPEHSVGTGRWARTKIAERECYVGDDAMEAPRFVSKRFYRLAGEWPAQAGAFDDWVFRDRLTHSGARIGRTQRHVLHNEGELRLSRLLRKKLIMGMSTKDVPQMPTREKLRRTSPVRLPSVIRRILYEHPRLLPTFLMMKGLESLAFYSGRIVAINHDRLIEMQQETPTQVTSESAQTSL